MGTDKRTIKSYDDYARKWVKRMRDGDNVAHDYLEKPAMYNKIPDLDGKSVLCVGCGSGEECDHLKSLGAAEVVGIDLSEGLLEIAKESYPGIEFHLMDMESIGLPESSFDFAYSSLVMHYIDNWQATLKGLYRVLKPGCRFLLSTHHPTFNGMEIVKEKNGWSRYLGRTKKTNGEIKIYGDYFKECLIDDRWFGDFDVSYYHRSMEAVMKDICRSGFQIIDFLEPKPVEAVRDIDPAFYEIHQRLPLFMIFELEKK
jgi:SAM-dependent methyltransferase